MNLRLLVLFIVVPILASDAHFNISAVYDKVQSGISSGKNFFSNIGRSISSAKESLNNLRKEVGTLKQKAKDNVLQILENICKNTKSKCDVVLQIMFIALQVQQTNTAKHERC